MTEKRTIALDRIRTDGWFERLGESIGSFHTLCDVLGERFFAFSLIVQARVSSLMIDRFSPDQSLVEFAFGGLDDAGRGESERLTVVEFRQRIVTTLLAREPEGPAADKIGDDLEALQRHIGSRTLLLAPLYGYGLKELAVDGKSSRLTVEREEQTLEYTVAELRAKLCDHVREDLERGVQRESGTAIDLNNVEQAEKAAAAGRWDKVVQLLGSWPMPLAIYWRTPEGQMLPEAARQRIAEGLGLLGTACAKLGDEAQGEEVLRLAVQYAQDGRAASGIFGRLGRILMEASRYGEAIAALRRAWALGGPAADVLPDLVTAFVRRERHLGALGYLLEAEAAGVPASMLEASRKLVDAKLGEPLVRWRALVG
jgi:hypothetical protein